MILVQNFLQLDLSTNILLTLNLERTKMVHIPSHQTYFHLNHRSGEEVMYYNYKLDFNP